MSSEDFADLSGFLKTYLPSFEKFAGRRIEAMEISSPGL